MLVTLLNAVWLLTLAGLHCVTSPFWGAMGQHCMKQYVNAYVFEDVFIYNTRIYVRRYTVRS